MLRLCGRRGGRGGGSGGWIWIARVSGRGRRDVIGIVISTIIISIIDVVVVVVVIVVGGCSNGDGGGGGCGCSIGSCGRSGGVVGEVWVVVSGGGLHRERLSVTKRGERRDGTGKDDVLGGG